MRLRRCWDLWRTRAWGSLWRGRRDRGRHIEDDLGARFHGARNRVHVVDPHPVVAGTHAPTDCKGHLAVGARPAGGDEGLVEVEAHRRAGRRLPRHIEPTAILGLDGGDLHLGAGRRWTARGWYRWPLGLLRTLGAGPRGGDAGLHGSLLLRLGRLRCARLSLRGLGFRGPVLRARLCTLGLWRLRVGEEDRRLVGGGERHQRTRVAALAHHDGDRIPRALARAVRGDRLQGDLVGTRLQWRRYECEKARLIGCGPGMDLAVPEHFDGRARDA